MLLLPVVRRNCAEFNGGNTNKSRRSLEEVVNLVSYTPYGQVRGLGDWLGMIWQAGD